MLIKYVVFLLFSVAQLAPCQSGKTKIVEGPEDFEGFIGSPAYFHCEIESDHNTDLKVEWTHNNEIIDFDREIRFSLEDDHTLIISALTDLDFGTYECIATTPFDSVSSSSAELTVTDIPGIAKIANIICDATNTTISWHLEESNPLRILHHTVIYSSNSAPETWITMCEKVFVPSDSCSSALLPGAGYTFELIATNLAGSSHPSKDSEVCSL